MIARRSHRAILLAVCVVFSASESYALDWPVWADSSSRSVSGVYGIPIDYGGPPYMHSGLDIAVPSGTPIYAIQPGYVKAIINLYGSHSSWRVVVADSADTCETDAWMYAHIMQLTIPVTVGQWVEIGDYLGGVVDWPFQPETVEHLHLSKIRFSGDSAHWADNFFLWDYIANPLDSMDDINDPDVPVLENAFGNQLLAFCQNESDVYFAEGAPISGDVDIICKAYDYYNFYDWKQVPYQVHYQIEGDSSIPWTTAISFTDAIGNYNTMQYYMDIVYQDDTTCDTYYHGFTYQDYYFNLSNSDGDLTVESSDRQLSWETGNFHNGNYTIFVTVSDKGGNSVTDSMTVTVENYFDLSGTVAYSDGNPDLAGAAATIASSGQSDTTDENGHFLIAGVAGGSQVVSLTRHGYSDLDTVVMVNRNRDIELILVPGGYICGDVDGNDSSPNVADLGYLVDYLFFDGPRPYVLPSGDVDGDGGVNVADLAYLVDYLFFDGPPLKCP